MAELDIGRFANARSYVSWHPDSYRTGGRFKTFPELLARFTAGAVENNGGDIGRAWGIILNIEQVLRDDVPGDFAELGVFRGNSASILAHYAANGRRELHLFDTFTGLDAQDLMAEASPQAPGTYAASMADVRTLLGDDGEACRFVGGRFPESVTEDLRSRRYAVVHLDCDLYEPMMAGLEHFYPRLSPGGLLLVHDYSSGCWPGATRALDDFMADKPEGLILMPDKSGTAGLRRNRQ